MKGKFYGIGVGPGDPDLITLKAIKILNSAGAVIAPKTEKKEGSTALEIARPFIRSEAQIVEMVFPMVYDQDLLSSAWENNKNTIIEFLGEGKIVVFLTMGDPMLYSTYIHVYRLLEGCGYPIETIPGITSFCAASSRLGFPLAEGNEVISIVPATNQEDKLERLISVSDSLVFLKAYKNIDSVLKKLKNYNLIKQAVLISKCGFKDEETLYNLNEYNNKKLNYLSIILTRKQQPKK